MPKTTVQEISTENETKVLSDILMVKALIVQVDENVRKIREDIKNLKLNLQQTQLLRNR